MAFINLTFNADLKQCNRLLGRIAHVLEQIAIEHYGLTLKEAAVPDEKDRGAATYTTDEAELRKEVVKAMEIEEEGHPEPEAQNVL